MPRNATTDQFGARFYSCSGDQLWSVTTVIKGGVPMPALPYWSAKEVAQGAVELLDELPGLVRQDKAAAIAMLKGLPWAKRDRAANLGSAVHAAAEAHALGKPMPPWADEIAPYMKAYVRFLEDFAPEYLMTEATVCNHKQRYAGTLDAIARIDGETLVLDTKTSASGVYADAALQLAAYSRAEHVQLPGGLFGDMPPSIDGGAVLHIRPDEYHLIPMRIDEPVFRSFLYAREVYRWALDISKGVMSAARQPNLERTLRRSVEAAEAVA